MTTLSDNRFWQAQGKYRYDWQICCPSGHVLRLKTAQDHAKRDIILDAKWCGDIPNEPHLLDGLIGLEVPLASPPTWPFLENGIWSRWEKDTAG